MSTAYVCLYKQSMALIRLLGGIGSHQTTPSLKLPCYLPSRLLKVQHIVSVESCSYRCQSGCLDLHEIRGCVWLSAGLLVFLVSTITTSGSLSTTYRHIIVKRPLLSPFDGTHWFSGSSWHFVSPAGLNLKLCFKTAQCRLKVQQFRHKC